MANHGYFTGQIVMLAAAAADFLRSISPLDFLRLISSAPWRASHTATKKARRTAGPCIVVDSNHGTLSCFFLDD